MFKLLQGSILVLGIFLTGISFTQAQLTRVVLSYPGPLGAYPTRPSTASGYGWLPLTHSSLPAVPEQGRLPMVNHFVGSVQFYTSARNIWITDRNGMGSIFPLPQDGTPDVIVINAGPVLQIGYRQVYIDSWKNGVKTVNPPKYLQHTRDLIPGSGP